MASGECVLICKQKKKFGSRFQSIWVKEQKRVQMGTWPIRKYMNYIPTKYHQPQIKRPAAYSFKKDPALKTDIKSAKRQYGLVPLPLSSDIDLAKN